jgi:hypothetical protein
MVLGLFSFSPVCYSAAVQATETPAIAEAQQELQRVQDQITVAKEAILEAVAGGGQSTPKVLRDVSEAKQLSQRIVRQAFWALLYAGALAVLEGYRLSRQHRPS